VPRIDEETIRALPKAEVHVHLEGAFELVDLIDLAKTAGVALPGPAQSLFDIGTHEAPPEDGTGGIGGGGLSGFLRFLDWQCSLVTTAEQAARAAYRFAARESASGVRYADVIVNPAHWSTWRGRTPQLLAAFAAGLDEAAQDGLAEVGLCVSVLRSQTSLEALELVDWMASARPDRVVALSVDGDERVSGRTGEKFAPAFAAAAAAGFHRTVHAGESSGPEGVWDALDLLLAERVDHGVRAVDDPALLARLVDDGVPLGVCPRSNVLLGVYPDWESHPVQRLRDAGVTVTVNTDDPAPLGTRLEFEWSMCADTFGWSLADLRGIAHNSITASFAHDDLKRDLHAEIDAFEADDAAGAPEDAAG
jgi:adenosine deaminase